MKPKRRDMEALLIDTMKMRKAYEWLDKAIMFEQNLPPTSASWYRMTKMCLNKACMLELEALGFVVYHHRFSGPHLGDIYAVHLGPVYKDENGVLHTRH